MKMWMTAFRFWFPRDVPVCLPLLVFLALGACGHAADQPQWGERFSRNMVSGETNLADDFDVVSGHNIKWKVRLGSETWATPMVAEGKVLIGTNNEFPRDVRHEGDRGILLCFDESDGRFLWQLVVPKLRPDRYKDWPRAGIVSPATVEAGRIYTVTNRCEVVCLDIEGLGNGNEGPYLDEAEHMAFAGHPAQAPGDRDADIVWLFDILKQAGTYPHDGAHSAILIDGDFLYLNTNNGVDNTHALIRKPDAPSLIVLDKRTGRLLACDRENIGPRIFHSTWSSPALGEVNGGRLVFFGGGDGVVYAFEALKAKPPAGEVQTLKLVWRFDCDPDGPKENVSEFLGNRREGPSNIKGMPVFHDGRVYVAVGGDIWWGKNQAWLQCIDATGTGDVTRTGLLWSHEVGRHCVATPALHDGLAFIADCDKQLHCLDAHTGESLWVHRGGGDYWASPLVADGKVYLGSRRGDFSILRASPQQKLLRTIRLDSGMGSTVTAANGVLYVATMHYLYAIEPEKSL